MALVGLALTIPCITSAQDSGGPVRLARVSFVGGNVSWRPDANSQWSQASVNMPVQQGAQVWASGDGEAEIQFDDGSDLRLGRGAVVTLQSLYSDNQGEFTEVKLTDGTASLHLKDQYSVYQVDTPTESLKANGPARFRVDVGNAVDVGVRTGTVTLSAASGDTTLRSGDYVEMRDSNDQVRIQDLPSEDSWDQFDDERDAAINGDTVHLPPNVALVGGDLNAYGSWVDDSQYGWTWCPREGANWRPYYYGHWVWCDPFGWTWVSDEPWGWAPYHYGSWIHRGWGWGWCPGPYHQYWSPGVVSFTSYGGNYAWAPLCPSEVRYPNYLSVGFSSGDWWLNFSIGGCAAYLPGGYGYCEPSVFPRRSFGGFGRSEPPIRQEFRNGRAFVPRNAQFGLVEVSEHNFGSNGGFRAIASNGSDYFRQGGSVMARGQAFSGPVTARPTATSFTPTHILSGHAQPTALNRPVFRTPNAGRVGSSTSAFGRGRGGNVNTGSSGRPTHSYAAADVASRARSSIGYVGRGGRVYGGSGSSQRSQDRTNGYNWRGSSGSTSGSRSSRSTGSSGYGRGSTSSGGSSARGGWGNSGNSGRSSSSGSSGYGRSSGSSSSSSGRGGWGNSGNSGRSSSSGSSGYGRSSGSSSSSSGRGGWGNSGNSGRSSSSGSSGYGRSSGSSSSSSGRGGWGSSGNSSRSSSSGSSGYGRSSGSSSSSSGRGGWGNSGNSGRSSSGSSSSGGRNSGGSSGGGGRGGSGRDNGSGRGGR